MNFHKELLVENNVVCRYPSPIEVSAWSPSCKMILNHTDNLTKALQDESCTTVEGQDAVMKRFKAMESTRNEDRYKDFMKAVKADQNRFEIDEPSLPRKRRWSEHVDRYFQSSTYHFPERNEQIFRRSYFEALHNAIQTIKARFDQTD